MSPQSVYIISNFGFPIPPKDLKGAVVKIAQFLERSLSDDAINKIVDHCTFDNMKQNPKASPDSIMMEQRQLEANMAKRENKSAEQLTKQNKFARPFMRKGE